MIALTFKKMKSVVLFAVFIQIAWSQEAAEPLSVPNRCHQVTDPGNCGRHFVHWFYNPAVGRCLQFQWTGCGGNGNRFETEDDCMSICGIEHGMTEDEQSEGSSGDDMETVDPMSTGNMQGSTEDNGSPNEPLNSANEQETEQANGEDEEMDDGTQDDAIIQKYMPNTNMGAEDSEILKEIMSRFEVSALENDGTEDVGSKIDHSQPDVVTKDENTEPRNNNKETREQDDEQQEEEGDEEMDDGTQDDSIIQKYMPNADMGPEDSEMLKEIMSRYDVSALENEEASEETYSQPDGAAKENAYSNENKEERSDKSLQAEIPGEIIQDETADEGDEFAEDNGKAVDSFIDHLGEAISPEDKETILEAIANFGAISLKAIDTVQRTMGIDVPEQMPQEQSAQNADTLTEEDTDKPEQGDDGIDSAAEYPGLSKVMSSEDPKGTESESGFVDMISTGKGADNDKNDDAADEDDSDEVDPVDDILQSEKDAIFNPKGMDPEDRFLLSELVSQYSVAVMEEKDDDKEGVNSKDTKKVDIPASEQNTDEYQKEFDPTKNEVKSSDDEGLLSPRCTLPSEMGPCRARMLMWYFDMESGDCRSFNYGGCQGNGNRFTTRRKCLKSCRGRIPTRNSIFKQAFQPNGNSRIPEGPTQSPTKRITFMMPLRNLFRNPEKEINHPALPPRMPMPRPEKQEHTRNNPFDFRQKILSFSGKLSPFVPKKLPEPRMPEPNQPPRGPFPPLSPLHLLLLRNLLKPQVKGGPFDAPPRMPQQQSPGLRVIKPPQLPVFQEQHPIPQLLRSVMQLGSENRRPAFDNQRISRGHPQRNSLDEDDDNELYPQFESSPGHTIFAPSMTKKSKFDSMTHDNRHFNNITPKNKFTLLQVFVNKPHGSPQTPSNSQIPSNMQSQPNKQIMPSPKIAPPQQNPAPPLISPQRPNMHPQPAFYSPHPVFNSHIHPQSMWNPPMSYPHMSPYHIPFMPRPYSPLSHHNPFFPHVHPSMPHLSSYVPHGRRGPPRSFEMPHPPNGQREDRQRPLVVVTDDDGEEENDSDAHYACLLPLAPGKCKAFQTKWFFNRETQKCEIFYFTGCAGNANNFQTWEECAATCLDVPSGPRTTLPGTETEAENEENQDDNSDEQETIIYTSTVFPETEEEAKLASAEVEASGGEKPPSIEELRTTTDMPIEENNEEVQVEQAIKDGLMEEGVVQEATGVSSEYIILMAVMATVALAVIVLISLSVVHLYRRSSATKKEKALEAVINHHLYGDIPKLAMVHTAPADVVATPAQA